MRLDRKVLSCKYQSTFQGGWESLQHKHTFLAGFQKNGPGLALQRDLRDTPAALHFPAPTRNAHEAVLTLQASPQSTENTQERKRKRPTGKLQGGCQTAASPHDTARGTSLLPSRRPPALPRAPSAGHGRCRRAASEGWWR